MSVLINLNATSTSGDLWLSILHFFPLKNPVVTVQWKHVQTSQIFRVHSKGSAHQADAGPFYRRPVVVAEE